MTPAIAVCDYGVGNVRSVERALQAAGATPVITSDPRTISRCDGVVLPGVGAFAVAARALRETGLGDAVRELARTGAPVLGVCLGHQLLFERSEEGDGGEGLGLLRGRVAPLTPHGDLKIPHIGWNTVTVLRASTVLEGIESGTYMYFVHSYAALPEEEDAVAVTDYGGRLVAAAERGNIMGTQFHPEKSGAPGLRVYANFAALCAARIPAGRGG